ncbi:hypothetical protein [Streptomyces sp. DT195]
MHSSPAMSRAAYARCGGDEAIGDHDDALERLCVDGPGGAYNGT